MLNMLLGYFQNIAQNDVNNLMRFITMILKKMLRFMNYL